MQTEQKIEGNTSFKEHRRISLFFDGSGRGEILQGLKTALAEGVNLTTLTGEEGSGKTMLCKMLQEDAGDSCKIVFLPQFVGSFEDVVRVIALECNVEIPVETDRGAAKTIFLELLASAREKGESIVLVCDEAEKLYLATLERIRKAIDDANNEGGGFQLLLSGRPELQQHLEQLELCDFAEISTRSFEVLPLSEDETWEYLNFCMEVRGEEKKEVFTREAAGKIASMAGGNLQMINMLADESLQSSNAESSFLVLLDHVDDSCAIEQPPKSPLTFLERYDFPRKYLYAGGAALLLLLVIVFAGGGDDEEPVAGGGAPEVVEEITEVYEPPLPDPVEEIVESPVVVPPVPEEKVEEIPVAVVETTPPELPVHPEIPAEESVPVEPELPVSSAGQEQHSPLEIAPVEIVEGSGAESTVLELSARDKVFHKNPVPEITATRKKKIVWGMNERPVVPTPKSVERKLPASAKDAVLGRFVVAGEKWRSGVHDNKFSIQLMVLTSDQAEMNLKRILNQPEYKGVADKLVVLERPTSPPVVLVFYGMYPSMAAARNARNNMPIFLRKHHPYAISVRGAVEKATVD